MSGHPPSYQPKNPGRQRPDRGDARPVGPPVTPSHPTPNPDPPSYAPGQRPSQQAPVAPPSYPPKPYTAPPSTPETPPEPHPIPQPRPSSRGRRGRKTLIIFGLILVLIFAWPIGLGFWANGKLSHVEVLSTASPTSGTTYLLAGSDSREGLEKGDAGFDNTDSARTDTILLLHVPESGTNSLISLPRDSYVDIPGHSASKLNAAYAWGGPKLLVETVEGFTGMTVDHYVEVGFAGITNIVDELGGVELCYDDDVSDRRSALEWKAGCHEADGPTALAFARMRYADKEGDIGRTNRQRQLIGAITSEATTASIALNPKRQVGLIEAATDSLVVDEDTNVIDLAKLALAFRQSTGPDGWSGTPPILSLNYRPGGVGAAVQLDESKLPGFFQKIREGNPPPTD